MSSAASFPKRPWLQDKKAKPMPEGQPDDIFSLDELYEKRKPMWEKLRRKHRIKWIGLGRILASERTCNYCHTGNSFIYAGPYFNNDMDWHTFICTSCGWKRFYMPGQALSIKEDFPEHYHKYLTAEKAREKKAVIVQESLPETPPTSPKRRFSLKIIVTFSKKLSKGKPAEVADVNAKKEKEREDKEFEKFQMELRAEFDNRMRTHKGTLK
jgi:hypothetical protein